MPMHAGAILRATRESYGASIEAVAAQLKLAPRQVQALEEGEFDLLPGRTFVRGFMRNYARLLELDPEVILQALPRGGASALEAPPLSSTTGTIGELPDSNATRPSWLRGSVALAVVIVVVAAAAYEYMQRSRGPAALGKSSANGAAAPADTATRARVDGAAPAVPDANETRAPAVQPNVAPLATAGAPAPVNTASTANAAQMSVLDQGALAPIRLDLRGTSWIEVRDATRRVVLAQTLKPGDVPTITGEPPFEVTIGNAPLVTLTFRGRTIDLLPYTRQNVARLTLQ